MCVPVCMCVSHGGFFRGTVFVLFCFFFQFVVNAVERTRGESGGTDEGNVETKDVH